MIDDAPLLMPGDEEELLLVPQLSGVMRLGPESNNHNNVRLILTITLRMGHTKVYLDG